MDNQSFEEQMLQIVGKLCDGTVAPTELDQLDQALLSNAGLRKETASYTRVHGELAWHFGTKPPASKEMTDAIGRISKPFFAEDFLRIKRWICEIAGWVSVRRLSVAVAATVNRCMARRIEHHDPVRFPEGVGSEWFFTYITGETQ